MFAVIAVTSENLDDFIVSIVHMESLLNTIETCSVQLIKLNFEVRSIIMIEIRLNGGMRLKICVYDPLKTCLLTCKTSKGMKSYHHACGKWDNWSEVM